MFPSKNTMEYMNEMQRLFSRNTSEFDIHSPMTSSSSHSFSHSIIPSSSSTETSPESYPETNCRTPEIFQRNYEKPEYFEQRREKLVLQRPQYFEQRHREEFPDRRLEFPDHRREFPDHRREFPDHRLEFPDHRREFPDHRREFPDHRREFPDHRREFPDHRREFPDHRREFPDHRQEPDRRLEEFQQDFETPFIIRRQRPIVGRKIMATTETLPKIEELDQFWSSNDFGQQTPPKSNAYELFPAENKGFEFRTPVKNTTPTYSSTPISPISSMTISPIPISPNSPKLVPISPKLVPQLPKPVPMSPILPNSRTGPKMIPVITKSPFPQKFLFHDKPGTSQTPQNFQEQMCTFCRKNGETPMVYLAHSVKEKIGNRNIVTCPILRRHVCQTCGASGDNAHTITYCPVLRSTNNGQPLRSTTITLKNTRVKSNGRRRF